MSKFLQLIKGAAKSNTIQINALLLAIWSAVLQTEFIQSNPDLVAIMGGVQAIINMLLRVKTSKPLSER